MLVGVLAFAWACAWPSLAIARLPLTPDATAQKNATGPDYRAYLEQRRQSIQHLATLLFRISRAAARDCPGMTAFPGLVLDLPDAYPPDLLPQIGLTAGDNRPRILAVAAGSPAAMAGLRADDRLILWPADAPLAGHRPSFAGIEAATAALDADLAAPAASAGVTLHAMRDGASRELALAAAPGCGGWLDLKTDTRANASSNQRWIQMYQGLLDLLGPDENALAFVLAHEMGHRTMRMADVARGLPYDAAHCGLRCEEEADRRALTYMRQAGYAPQVALGVLARLSAHGSAWDSLNGRRQGLAARQRLIQATLATPPAP